MDGQRFDELARFLAGSSSRRRVVRGLVDGVVAGVIAVGWRGRAGAQEAVPLGGTCAATDQCGQDGFGDIVCGDNGLSGDGAFNCCRERGCCTADADCCGDLLCAPAPDVCNVCLRPPFATQFIGDQCTESSQCVGSVVGSVICADNGVAEDGSLTCCVEEGGGCSTDAACCGSALCLDGICGGGPFVPKFPPGAECAGSNQCSQRGGETICADNGIAGDGALNCCRIAGGNCADGAGCCGALLCVGGVCQEAVARSASARAGRVPS